MAVCSGVLRSLGSGASSMEDAAVGIVRHLYENLIDGETGQKALTLIRFFKTHAYKDLDAELQAFAVKMLGGPATSPEMKCLTMLASAGLEKSWNDRHISQGHKALPLPYEGFIEKFPMVRQLIQQFGLEVNTVLKPNPKVLLDMSQRTYNVFFVPDAVGSEYVPPQKDFVIPYGVRCVLGFGGALPSGNIFAIIMFPTVQLSDRVADMFRTLALSVKLAVLPFDGGKIFSPQVGEPNSLAVAKE